NHGFSTVDDDESLTANIADCRDAVEDEWDFTIRFDQDSYVDPEGGYSDYSLKIESASGACTTELSQTAENCTLFQGSAKVPSTLSVTRSLTFAELTGVTDPDACLGKTGTYSLVVASERVEEDLTDGTWDRTPVADRYSIVFSTTRPDAPGTIAATAGENN